VRQLRAKYSQPWLVIWDNSSAHRGQPMGDYLTTPDLRLRLIALPAYSPDFADEALWAWAREKVTVNRCFGTKAKLQEAWALVAGVS